MDLRIPNASTAWQLWHTDMFDRDSPPYLQASGTNILQGLYELWLYTLKEGIQDNASATFSRFHLTWGNTPATRLEVVVNPFDNPALIKLRRWAKLMSQEQEWEDMRISQNHAEQNNPLIMKLAQFHYELLKKSGRWMADAIDWDAEARDLLARVRFLADPSEL